MTSILPAQRDVDIAPRAIDRMAPDYPDECKSEEDPPGKRDEVVVRYDITADGRTENIRIASTTNSCFDSAAIDAVREWTFVPRRVNGEPAAQRDVETKVTFLLEDRQWPDWSQDLLGGRVQAAYPEKCMAHAKEVELVAIRFDITPDGHTENIRVMNSTNKCLNEAAVQSVAQWRYEPRIVNGEAVARRDVDTIVTYKLEP